MKRFYLLLSLLALFGCTDSEPARTENSKIIPLQNTDTVPSVVQIDSVLILPDSTEIETPHAFWDKPMLVIENCAALWNEVCYTDSAYRTNYAFLVKEYLKSEKIISIGENGIQKQVLDSSFCMQGECYGNQIAIALSNEECFGILVNEDFLSSYISIEKLSRVRDTANLGNIFETKQDKEYLDRNIYSNEEKNIFIRITGFGYIQENDWPIFETIHTEIVTEKNGEYIISGTFNLGISSTNLPIPTQFIKEKNAEKIIWWHGEGICCPSNSQTWITQIDSSGITNGKFWKGGLGQPCD